MSKLTTALALRTAINALRDSAESRTMTTASHRYVVGYWESLWPSEPYMRHRVLVDMELWAVVAGQDCAHHRWTATSVEDPGYMQQILDETYRDFFSDQAPMGSTTSTHSHHGQRKHGSGRRRTTPRSDAPLTLWGYRGRPALRQVPPFSRQGREACAQGPAGQERSTRIPTKGRPVIHGMCFASSSNRKRCIGKGRSVLSAILACQKHPLQCTGVFRVGARLKLFRSTSRKQGTVPFRPPSRTQLTYAISIVYAQSGERRTRWRLIFPANEVQGSGIC
jgi:hypothetical protein